MPHTTEIKDNKATIVITIPANEVEKGMEHASVHIAEDLTIPGFRPGKAPYDVVKKHVGEMKLLEAAAEELIRNAFAEAVNSEALQTVGQPFFSAEKMVPGEDMVITAEIALYPKVLKVADYTKAVIDSKDTKPTKKMIDQAKKDLTSMQTREIRRETKEELKKGDKAIIDLTMKKDGVVLEGGEGKSHSVYTEEGHYIPGIIDEILGMKEGETKDFTLPFPKDHYQKHLAGQDVDFTVSLNEIFKLETPKLDDDFAKSLGLGDLKNLEEKLEENLQIENAQEENTRQEKELLELLSEKSTFEEIPDLLVNQEASQMIGELEQSVIAKGAKFDEYLKSINKTVNDLKLDFAKTALQRVKVALLLKEIAEKESITVETEELDNEIDKVAEHYKDNDDIRKQIFTPRYRDFVEHQMRNKKTIDFLKEKMIKA